jgi:hypothetical protein
VDLSGVDIVSGVKRPGDLIPPYENVVLIEIACRENRALLSLEDCIAHGRAARIRVKD